MLYNNMDDNIKYAITSNKWKTINDALDAGYDNAYEDQYGSIIAVSDNLPKSNTSEYVIFEGHIEIADLEGNSNVHKLMMNKYIKQSKKEKKTDD